MFYEDDAHCQKAIEKLVDEAIGEKGKWNISLGWADSIKPDRIWSHHVFVALVLELKNTLGLSGDALPQAVIDYSKIVLREKVQCPIVTAFYPYHCLQFKHFQEFCNFPIVLIGATANCLKISVAVSHARPFIRVSCLQQHHLPGPCLPGLVTLSGRSQNIL